MMCGVNRRDFLKRLHAAIIASSCVSSLKAFEHVRDDNCPGGGPNYDTCIPETRNDPDSCPGEMRPIDECERGGRDEDYCDSGRDDADVCSSKVEGSDQCQSGIHEDDSCDENDNNPDQCYSGKSPNPDACASDGGFLDGDNCPGGGAAVDNCGADGKGDECSPEQGYGISFGSDQCKEESSDECWLTPDVCNNGTNTATGLGDDDICGAAFGFGPEGSDTCLDGSPEQDECGTIEGDPDLCIVSVAGDNGDFCDPSAKYPSDDICFRGMLSSDKCFPHLNDKDECPNGGYPADECSSSYPEDDICMPEDASTDHCDYGTSEDDECFGIQDSCSSGNQDTVE